jgi:hypothetical protein
MNEPIRPADPPNGIRCPQCHCRHLPALYTRRVGNTMIRVRRCRHCGRRIQTREEIRSYGTGPA